MLPIARCAPPLLFAALFALAACGSEPDKAEMAALDNSLAGNAASAGLDKQIVVDPARVDGAPALGAKPAAAELGTLKRAPAPGSTPAPAAVPAPAPGDGSCTTGLAQDAAWAGKLPAELPVFPRARVSEAAGKDDRGCRARAVTFATVASVDQVIDYYYTRATAAGFTAEHLLQGKEHVLGGTRERDGGAYYLLARALPGGGTEVDLITNNGR